MSSPKAQSHNSKSKNNKSYIPPLQKKILKYLSKSDPLTINETTKALKCHYKSTWNAFHGLEQKNLIKVVGNKLYQGKEFPRYWVSGNGAFVALCEGAKADKLILKVKEIYPDDRSLHYVLEATSIVGTDSFEIGYNALVNNGKLNKEDVVKMLLNQVLQSISEENIAKFLELLGNYPEYGLELEKIMNALTTNICAFDDKLKKPKSDL
jgi:hypothetical protein